MVQFKPANDRVNSPDQLNAFLVRTAADKSAIRVLRSISRHETGEMSLISEPQPAVSNEKADQTNELVPETKTENAVDEESECKSSDFKMEVDQRPATPKAEANTADPCRVQIADDLIDSLTKEDLIKKWKQQNDYIDSLEQKLKLELSSKEMYQDHEDKIKQQLFDLTRKENILLMKLTTKEHEIQDYIVSFGLSFFVD